jgi:hypothetical protein
MTDFLQMLGFIVSSEEDDIWEEPYCNGVQMATSRCKNQETIKYKLTNL